MTTAAHQPWAPLIGWYLRRNPTYLVSAAAMAVGAKLYLDAPETTAGQVGHILLTLGLLEIYELAVAGILVALHRARRSPEDLPSLLLVTAIFWTGPLAATLELTARSAALGHALAAAAWLIAAIELWGVVRAVRLRTSPAGRMVCILSLTLVAAMPAVLRVPYGEPGTSETALYGAWWLLGLFALFALPAMRWHFVPPDRRAPRAAETELVLLVVVLLATGAHLYGMNYVFWGNARSFYASPLLAAMCALMFELLALLRVRAKGWIALAALIPVVGLVGALEGFSSLVPLKELPRPARDALAIALLLAGGCWWYGAARHRSIALFHFGTAALALALVRMWSSPGTPPCEPAADGGPLPIWVAAAGFSVAAYLLLIALLLRSRAHAALAVAACYGGIAALVCERYVFDRLVIVACGAWCWLALLELAQHRGLAARLLGAAVLVGVASYYDGHVELRWAARGQMLVAVALFGLIGVLWPQTRCRLLAIFAGAVWIGYLLWRHVYAGPVGTPAAVVTGAFGLLGVAAAISWHKSRLMPAPVELAPSNNDRDRLDNEPGTAAEG